MMETIEYFSDFLRKTGAPNFLAIGIVIVAIGLLISGFRKGLNREGRNKEFQKDEKNRNKNSSESAFNDK